MSPIKAIETRYNGYRFRSRLEARWAVFFDCAGIPYQYEPEGYELGEVFYLPDFYLPDHGIFVEIKAEEPNSTETYKASGLAHRTKKAVIIHEGAPWFNIINYKYVNYDPEDTNEVVNLAEHFRSNQEEWLSENRYCFGAYTWMYNNGPFIGCLVEPERVAFAKHPILINAYNQARSARFETGRR